MSAHVDVHANAYIRDIDRHTDTNIEPHIHFKEQNLEI